jgi:hypothetical protein
MNDRFGSDSEVAAPTSYVRCNPNSGHELGFHHPERGRLPTGNVAPGPGARPAAPFWPGAAMLISTEHRLLCVGHALTCRHADPNVTEMWWQRCQKGSVDEIGIVAKSGLRVRGNGADAHF